MARPKFAVGMPGIRKLIVTITGSVLEAFIAGTSKISMPCTGKVVGVGLNIGAVGGTYSVATLDVTKDGTSILTAAFDVAAAVGGTPIQKEGTALAAGAASVAAGAVIGLTTAVTGGTSPTWRLAVVEIDYVPLGD